MIPEAAAGLKRALRLEDDEPKDNRVGMSCRIRRRLVRLFFGGHERCGAKAVTKSNLAQGQFVREGLFKGAAVELCAP